MGHTGFKKFIVHGFLFILPIALVVGYTEYRLRAIPNSYNTKRMYLERQLDSIEVLALGSSQMNGAFNPAVVHMRGFNLCNTAQPLSADIQLARRYIPRMPKLRTVLLSVSYFSFGYNLEDGESWRNYYYYHFWDIKAGDFKWYDSRAVSYIALYEPLTVLRYAWQGFNVNEARAIQSNGWRKGESTCYDLINDKMGHERVNIHNALMNQSRVNENFTQFSELIQELRTRQISVILVTPPVYTTYSKFMDPATVAFNKRLVDSLCTMYGCSYMDLSTDSRFGITDFEDNDHLNQAGAEKISSILDQKILAMPL